ncbi:MAG: PIG-L family deacetylase [Thermodesulfobacteriota bacterium]
MIKSNSNLIGQIEFFDNSVVKGWALNQALPDEPIKILVEQGGQVVSEITPSIFRWDLKEKGYGKGYHGFMYRISSEFQDGGEYEFNFVFEHTKETLDQCPVRINHLWEEDCTPFKTVDLTNNIVLVLAPHADDESFACGGSLVNHVNQDDKVKVVILTDGSKADFTGKYNKEDYIQIRENEAKRACDMLGVSDVEFWRNPDRDLQSNVKNINLLSDLIDEYKPTLIYVPSPLEFHPDHRAAADILWRAIQKSQHICSVAFSEINTAIRINSLVDISGTVEKKKEACDSYQSQLDNIPYTDFALGLNRYRALTVSSKCSYAEGFFVMDSRDIINNPIEYFSKQQFFSAFTEKKENRPLVSIIVRTKDRPVLLRDTLSSIVMQSYPNIEIVLVNDGEQDLTKTVEEFKAYTEIQYIKLQDSRGRTAAGNEGIRASRGKYINFLDDDDVFYFNHVQKLADYLETTGQKVAYSDCEIGRYKWVNDEFILKGEKEFFRGVEHDLDQLYVTNYLPNMTVMFAKELCETAGYPDETLEIYEDWDLFLRLSLNSNGSRVPGATAEYRIFADHNYDFSKWRFKIYDKYKDYFKTENYEQWFLKRIDDLYEENRYLRRRLANNEETLKSTYPLGSHIDSRTMWKIKTAIKKYVPERFLNYLRSVKNLSR